MKKIFIALLSLMCLSTFAAKKSPVTIKSGSAEFLKKESIVNVIYDYTSARWEEDEDYKTWCDEGNDYEKRVQIGYDAFIEAFNVNNSILKAQKDAAGASITFNIKLTNLERKQGPGIWGSMFNRIYGEISVIDNATENEICKINIDGVRGDTDFNLYDRMYKCFAELGKHIATLK